MVNESHHKLTVSNSMTEPFTSTAEHRVLKLDDEQRIVWGWATVVTVDGAPVVDLQGDVISPNEMLKMANGYMLDSRIGLDMHQGEPTSVTLHSFPLTKELQEAFGIQCDREGWIIAQKILSDEKWAEIKAGGRLAFSIGGVADVEEIDE